MSKLIAVASALLIATSGAAFAGHKTLVKKPRAASKGTVAANGRCNGISYGTGARRCGSLSGGPVGGISGRN